MAELVQQKTFTWDKTTGVNTFSVTLDQPAAAGSTLVAIVYGGDIVTVRLTDAAGALFAKRIEVAPANVGALYDATAAGGETTVHFSLNAADGENETGVVYELSGIGAFIGASGSAQTIDNTSYFQSRPATAVTVASGSAVLVGGWGSNLPTNDIDFGNPDNHWRQMEPSGVLHSEGNQQSAAGGAWFLWGSGLADVGAGDYQASSMFYGSPARTAYAVQAAYANAGDPVNAPVTKTVTENRRVGTPRANWFLGAAGWNGTLAGYTDKLSYLPGESVNFLVDSDNLGFTVEVFRLGAYGHEEVGARNVLGPGGTITGTPAVQAAPTVDATLGSTSCAWTTTATWTVPADAASGVYWFLLRRTDDPTLNISSGHFVVRDTSVAGKAVVVVPDCTHHAYNLWGARTDNGPRSAGGVWTGRSLYQIGTDLDVPNFANRAYAVSFDRPLASGKTQANTYMFDADYSVWHFLEAQGYDLTYISDTDLEADPTYLVGASMALVVGHHEYISQGIWDALKTAIDNGVHTVWHGSNIALWRTRFTDTGRTLVCYKDNASVDVSPGFDAGTGRDPVEYTGTWRDTRPELNANPRPEAMLTGQMFVANAPAAKQLTVGFDQQGVPLWRNSPGVTALTSGMVYTTPTDVYGDEGDFVDTRFARPENLVQLCPTVVSLTSGSNVNGTIYSTAYTDITIGFTLYRASSGALVFATGSWRGWEGVSRWARNEYSATVMTPNINWQNAANAILHDLGGRPGTVRPLRPTDTDLTDPSVGAPVGDSDDVTLAYGLSLGSTFTGWGIPL